ncbi:DUF4232 domain-containing protein [Streptomyces sp. NPDC051636]|uniref:DUF4232 domain-containing protein n=1 Tax=Streptomyces sp. NPDC051636 TaxID=3365663 RepID=UPI0037AE75D3
MRATPAILSTVVAGILLLTTSCSQATGLAVPSDPDGPTCDAQVSSEPATPAEPTAEATGDVTITDPGGDGAHDCGRFQVTNHAAKPSTYTITFTFLSDSGAQLADTYRTVPSVGPGRTVSGTVGASDLPPGAEGWSRVRVEKVRSVPVDEAPAPGGRCPSSGLRLYADEGDAAMGLRVAGLHLVNCGTRTQRLTGYPRVSLLDEDHRPVTGVRILHDGSAIASGTGADGPARPLSLKPGERALAGLVRRNTVLDGTAVNVPYVRVRAKPGAAPVMVTPELDLGTTGKVAVGPWKREAQAIPAQAIHAKTVRTSRLTGAHPPAGGRRFRTGPPRAARRGWGDGR